MNKGLVGVIIAAVAILTLAGVYVMNRTSDQTATETGVNSAARSSEQMSGTPQTTMNQRSESSSNEQSSKQVDFVDFAFSQKRITIKKGETVTWTNKDSSRHNAYSDSAGGPKGKLLSEGESDSFTFNTVGSFDIYCEPHPYMKMVVEVTE